MSLEGDLTALRGTVASLQQELGTELLSQLDSNDQVRIAKGCNPPPLKTIRRCEGQFYGVLTKDVFPE